MESIHSINIEDNDEESDDKRRLPGTTDPTTSIDTFPNESRDIKNSSTSAVVRGIENINEKLNYYTSDTNITVDSFRNDRPKGILRKPTFRYNVLQLLDNSGGDISTDASSTGIPITRLKHSPRDGTNTDIGIHADCTVDGNCTHTCIDNNQIHLPSSGWNVSEMNNILYNKNKNNNNNSSSFTDGKPMVDESLIPDDVQLLHERCYSHFSLQQKRQRLNDLHDQIQQTEAMLLVLQNQSDKVFVTLMTDNVENQELYMEFQQRYHLIVNNNNVPSSDTLTKYENDGSYRIPTIDTV